MTNLEKASIALELLRGEEFEDWLSAAGLTCDQIDDLQRRVIPGHFNLRPSEFDVYQELDRQLCEYSNPFTGK